MTGSFVFLTKANFLCSFSVTILWQNDVIKHQLLASLLAAISSNGSYYLILQAWKHMSYQFIVNCEWTSETLILL